MEKKIMIGSLMPAIETIDKSLFEQINNTISLFYKNLNQLCSNDKIKPLTVKMAKRMLSISLMQYLTNNFDNKIFELVFAFYALDINDVLNMPVTIINIYDVLLKYFSTKNNYEKCVANKKSNIDAFEFDKKYELFSSGVKDELHQLNPNNFNSDDVIPRVVEILARNFSLVFFGMKTSNELLEELKEIFLNNCSNFVDLKKSIDEAIKYLICIAL